MHLFLPSHRSHRFIVGLVQGLVSERSLGFPLQLVSHQQLVAQERQTPLEVRIVAEIFLVGSLRHHDYVGEIRNQIFVLGFRRRRLHVGAHVLFGQRQIALCDVDTIDTRDDRVGRGGWRF